MKKLILAATIVMGGLCLSAGASQAASRHQSEGYADNARAACILPWYRFFGACDEAIDDYPYGNKWHEWQDNNHHRHGPYRR